MSDEGLTECRLLMWFGTLCGLIRLTISGNLIPTFKSSRLSNNWKFILDQLQSHQSNSNWSKMVFELEHYKIWVNAYKLVEIIENPRCISLNLNPTSIYIFGQPMLNTLY